MFGWTSEGTRGPFLSGLFSRKVPSLCNSQRLATSLVKSKKGRSLGRPLEENKIKPSLSSTWRRREASQGLPLLALAGCLHLELFLRPSLALELELVQVLKGELVLTLPF